MSDSLLVPLLVASTVTTGLVAGLFFAFTCAVMPGLRRAEDAVFVATMTAINAAIQNIVFAVAFGGALLFTAGALVAGVASGSPTVPWVMAGLGLYVATLVVTGVRNVPLNNQLDAHAARPDVTAAEARSAFETPWTRWNTLRTVLSTAALGCLAGALLAAS